jgi:aquaporin Z
VSVALAHGLVIAVMASAVGHISGGHFNPAVTLGFLITRRLAPSLALVYWSVQFLGAAAAALLLKWFYPENVRAISNLGSPALGSGVSVWQGVVIELVMTFFLVWVIFATAADPGGAFKSIAGLAIGLTITLDILMGGPLTGAAMNPARAFGPELVSRDWSDAWVWYLGPFLGGALAAVVYEWLYLRPPAPLPVGPPETGVIEPRPGDAAVS